MSEQVSLEKENAQLKQTVKDLHLQMAELDGERLSQKMMADEAINMLSKEQRLELSRIVLGHMLQVLITGKIPNDDHKYN